MNLLKNVMKYYSQKLLLVIVLLVTGCIIFLRSNYNQTNSEKNLEKEDGIKESQELEFRMTKDPALGIVPRSRLYNSIDDLMRQRQSLGNSTNRTESLTWTERGSYTDDV